MGKHIGKMLAEEKRQCRLQLLLKTADEVEEKQVAPVTQAKIKNRTTGKAVNL